MFLEDHATTTRPSYASSSRGKNTLRVLACTCHKIDNVLCKWVVVLHLDNAFMVGFGGPLWNLPVKFVQR
eukprot:5635373-Amphidinium_carterae.1